MSFADWVKDGWLVTQKQPRTNVQRALDHNDRIQLTQPDEIKQRNFSTCSRTVSA